MRCNQSPRTPLGAKPRYAVEQQSIILSKNRNGGNIHNLETSDWQQAQDSLHDMKLRERWNMFEQYRGNASRNNWEELCSPTTTGKARVAKPAALSGNYDVITGEWNIKPSVEKVMQRERPQSADARSMLGKRNDKYTQSSYDKKTNQWVVEDVAHGPKRVPHPAHVGDYNPIKQEWIKEPVDKRFLDRDTTINHGFGNKYKMGRKRIPLPPDIGRYNPITNTWILPPSDKKFENREAFPAQGRRASQAIGKGRVEIEQKVRGTYDPIKNKWLDAPEDPRAHDRAKSVLNVTRQI